MSLRKTSASLIHWRAEEGFQRKAGEDSGIKGRIRDEERRFGKVYEANEIDIPDVMVEDQIDEMMQEFDQQLRIRAWTFRSTLSICRKSQGIP